MASIPDSRAPWLKLWVADFVSSTYAMTPAQVGAHLRMMLHAWERGDVPADPSALRRITGDIDEGEMAEVLRRWQRDGERLVNRRLEVERAEMIDLHDRRSEAGRRGSFRRWQTHSKPIANGMANAMANGMACSDAQMLRGSDAQKPNAQTHNQHGASARPAARARGAITFDYATGRMDGITDTHRERWAAAYPAVEIDQQVAAASAWLAANPTQRKKNVHRFLTNWLARQQERGGVRQPRVPSHSPRTFDDVPEHLRF